MKPIAAIGLLVCTAIGCTTANASRVEVEQPVRENALGGFTRVLVAGFFASRTEGFDLNQETARFLNMDLRSKAALNVVEFEPLKLETISALGENPSAGSNEGAFRNVHFWKTLGEEYSRPLIVAGTVSFEHRTTGPRQQSASLRLRLVFISGQTGEVIRSVAVRERSTYGNRRDTDLSLYLKLMDDTMPSILELFGLKVTRRVLLR